MSLPKITFGIVNCNRLFYLKSCLESLLVSTSDYDNKEIIIVDNASVEEGTEEYLLEKEKNSIITVVRQEEREPQNEFAIALNKIAEMSSGDLVCPLQGDTQFIIKSGWLHEYAKIFEECRPYIGCIGLDAQRNTRIQSHMPFGLFSEDHLERPFSFFIDLKRNPISGAGDVFYPREILDKIYPWHVKNENHEGGQDSETAMLIKARELLNTGEMGPRLFLTPQIPVSVAIYTDSRGTNARVRGNKRYGDYWEGNSENLYYNMIDFDKAVSLKDKNNGLPLPIELMASSATGRDLPIDSQGNWMKNPIRPEEASSDDYAILYDDHDSELENENDHEYIDSWLSDE